MGSAVFRVRTGDQIVTQYNPIVANPNTVPQQNGRARFKLVSQLSVALKSAIVAPADRRQSARNSFIHRNYHQTVLDPDPTAADKATIDLRQVQLTPSNRPFGNMEVTYTGGDINVTITSPGGTIAQRKGKIVLVGIGTVGTTKSAYVVGEVTGNFSADDGASVKFEDVPEGDYVVLAYGIDPTSESTNVSLGEMVSEGTTAMVTISDLVRLGAASVTATIGASITVPAGE